MHCHLAPHQGDELTGQGRHARAGGDAAGDVEWIGRGQDQRLFVWLLGGPHGPLAVRVQPPQSEARRHRRKYAEGKLGADRSFFFRGPAGKLNLRAHNLNMFIQIAEGVDDETWLHHLRNGDYSQWLREAIKDEALANEVREIEKDGKEGPQKSRSAVIEAINRRYTRSE